MGVTRRRPGGCRQEQIHHGLVTLAISVASLLHCSSAQQQELTTTTICRDRFLDINCGSSHQIFINEAFYGTRNRDKYQNVCNIPNDSNFNSCDVDKTNTLRNMCSGRHRCVLNPYRHTLFGPSNVCGQSKLDVEYSCIPSVQIYSRCDNQNISPDSGFRYIQSQNYPLKAPYSLPNNQPCVWTITAPDDYYIRLEFLDFDLVDGPGNSCIDNYLNVYEKVDDDSTSSQPWRQRAVLCGNRVPDPVTYTSNAVSLQYFTNALSNSQTRGFWMKFTKFKRPSVTRLPIDLKWPLGDLSDTHSRPAITDGVTLDPDTANEVSTGQRLVDVTGSTAASTFKNETRVDVARGASYGTIIEAKRRRGLHDLLLAIIIPIVILLLLLILILALVFCLRRKSRGKAPPSPPTAAREPNIVLVADHHQSRGGRDRNGSSQGDSSFDSRGDDSLRGSQARLHVAGHSGRSGHSSRRVHESRYDERRDERRVAHEHHRTAADYETHPKAVYAPTYSLVYTTVDKNDKKKGKKLSKKESKRAAEYVIRQQQVDPRPAHVIYDDVTYTSGETHQVVYSERQPTDDGYDSRMQTPAGEDSRGVSPEKSTVVADTPRSRSSAAMGDYWYGQPIPVKHGSTRGAKLSLPPRKNSVSSYGSGVIMHDNEISEMEA